LEHASDVVGCSLSDIVQMGEDLNAYLISPRAAEGILRRAARKGKRVPRQLLEALQGASSTD
jgi:hypothetical protein